VTNLDFAKALLVALALMAVNVAISFAVVAVYSIAIDPGHDEAYYEGMALRIVPWSSVVFGVVLFFLAGFVAARRKPQRSALGFAFASAVFYIGIDASLLFLAGSLQALGAIVPLSYGTKLLSALAGAYAGCRP
jgi:hypothetical protein